MSHRHEFQQCNNYHIVCVLIINQCALCYEYIIILHCTNIFISPGTEISVSCTCISKRINTIQICHEIFYKHIVQKNQQQLNMFIKQYEKVIYILNNKFLVVNNLIQNILSLTENLYRIFYITIYNTRRYIHITFNNN